MLKRFAYVTVVWPLRVVYYPLLRFLGRITRQDEFAKRLIEVAEENIERTMETLEGDGE